ncbi:expressed unknown protein [Seminavis robusta]|uniref:Uncharacterized protein n=1 Tax=Seminavis robusta TaxID=568900 RepID=A0A9N8ER15_9STRA|nr:expressed unknown protein [Seminavis robusta]|eukprot:Sro1645_g288240.1 n/a (366) ;mRNA; f:13157-14254
MGFFLTLGRLVGSKVHENQTPIDAERTKRVGEFFDTRGPSSSRYRIRRKILTLEKRRKTVKERKERFKLTVKAKKVKYAQAKNKTTSNQQVLEDLEAKVAAAKSAVDAAKRKEDEAGDDVDHDVAVLVDLEAQEKKIFEELVEAENDMKILDEIEVCHQNPQGKAKLPLAGERSLEELRGAVWEYVPSFESLCSEIDCPIDTLKKVLNFLSLNGVGGALITPRTSDNVVLLRRQLAEILFPEFRPPREPSLSPESKLKAMAAELYDDADAIDKSIEGDRQAKRKIRVATSAPPRKKPKFSSEVLEELEARLSPETLAALGLATGKDAEDKPFFASAEDKPSSASAEDGPSSASAAQEEETEACET